MMTVMFWVIYLCFAHQSNQDILILKTDLIKYENYKNEEFFLTPFSSSVGNIKVKDYSVDPGFEPNIANMVSNDQYVSLIRLPLICRWTVLNSENNPGSKYPIDYEKFIKERSQEVKIFYLCEINHRGPFKSYLLLVKDNETDLFKNRYLIRINIYNNIIKSAVVMADYRSDGLSSFETSTDKKKGKFIFKLILKSNDMDYTEEARKDLLSIDKDFFARKVYYVTYIIDKYGFVIPDI